MTSVKLQLQRSRGVWKCCLSVCLSEGAVRVHSLPPRCLFDGHPTFGKEKPKLVGYA